MAADDADPDDDGHPNVWEYVAGTDPKDPDDVLRTVSVTREQGAFIVSVHGREGRIYELQLIADLAAPDSTAVATEGPLTENGAITLRDETAPSAAAFYRVRVSLAPGDP